MENPIVMSDEIILKKKGKPRVDPEIRRAKHYATNKVYLDKRSKKSFLIEKTAKLKNILEEVDDLTKILNENEINMIYENLIIVIQKIQKNN